MLIDSMRSDINKLNPIKFGFMFPKLLNKKLNVAFHVITIEM